MIIIFQIIYSLYFYFISSYPAPEFIIFPYLVNNGLLPYSQIIDQHMPGLFLLPVNFADLGFNTPDSFRWLVLVLSVIQIVFAVKLSKLININGGVYVVLIMFFLMNLFGITSLWYESFLVLTLIPSLIYLFKKNYFLSFFLFGLSILFKQTAAVYFIPILIYSFIQEGFRKTIRYLLVSLIPLGSLILYYYSVGILKDFFYWTTSFNLNSYAQIASQTPPSKVVFQVILITFVCILSVMKFKEKKLIVVLSVSIFSLIGAFIRYSPAQLIIYVTLSAVLISKLLSIKKPYIYINTLLIISSIYFLLNKTNNYHFNYYSSDIYEISNRINNLADKNEEIFILGAQPHIYQISETMPSGKYFSYQLPWYTKVNLNRIESSVIESNPRYILIDKDSNIDGINIVDQFTNVNKHIKEKYKLIDQYKNYEIYAIKI